MTWAHLFLPPSKPPNPKLNALPRSFLSPHTTTIEEDGGAWAVLLHSQPPRAHCTLLLLLLLLLLALSSWRLFVPCDAPI